MPWNFQNFEISAEKNSVWCFFDEKIRLLRLDFELETKITKKFPIGDHGRSKRVTTDRTAKPALNLGDILDVIDVPMCQEQEFEIDLERTQPFTSALRGIEENPSLWRLEEIAIRFENAAAKAFVIHCTSLPPHLATA